MTMIMGLQKKRNVIMVTICMVICFIMYQLYFFVTITSETTNTKVNPIIKHSSARNLVHLRSEADKNINDNGVLRGVMFSDMPHYRPNSNNQFKCLKSDQLIPFDQVNDDYCDCDDATDEPSTTACVNGTFYCNTQYHKKLLLVNSIPSNKVNDGICDCCDGSDEWLHQSSKKLLTQSSSKQHRQFASQCLNVCFE